MAVHYSPAQLANTGFTVESKNQPNGAAVLVVQANGHKLTPAGIKAVLAVINSYIGALTAPNLATVVVYGATQVGAGYVQFPCLQADLAAQSAAVAAALSTAANVVAA